MLTETKPAVYQSELLNRIPGVIHGFSTRKLGDMRQVAPRHVLKNALGLSRCWLVGAEQIHKNDVHIITPVDYGLTVPEVDGLVTSQHARAQRVALGIITADCVPLLFVDPEARVIAAAHAGWKGTRDTIASNVIRKMVQTGAKPENIRVVFGPHIGPCCYTVGEDRALIFQEHFRSKDVVLKRGNSWFLDLGKANEKTLIDEGILPSHIGNHLLCTYDHTNEFYSYRRNDATNGEQMSLIALSA